MRSTNDTRVPIPIKITNNAIPIGNLSGFLSQYIQQKPIGACVSCGIWAASEVIQQLGCTLPTIVDKDGKF